MNMKAREQIKSLLAAKNIKMKELCLLLSEKMGKIIVQIIFQTNLLEEV